MMTPDEFMQYATTQSAIHKIRQHSFYKGLVVGALIGVPIGWFVCQFLTQ